MQPLQTNFSPKLECIGISKAYGNEAILSSINLSAREGEIISVLGMSGIGKSTLLKVISGLTAPDNGSVIIGGEDCTGITGKVSFMRQDSLLMPWKTVIDNIILPLTVSGVKKAEAYRRAEQHLAYFGLEACKKLYPSQISGGMARRVSLLRAYLFSSDILLLDEPFSSLDTLTRISVYEWFLTTVRDLKMTSVLVTHDINEAVYLSDKVYIIKGRPAEIASEVKIDADKQGFRETSASSAFHTVADRLASVIFEDEVDKQ
jgi:ABC-type nitrate/sulfonate/bicarbonate transport system ATPase subunit